MRNDKIVLDGYFSAIYKAIIWILNVSSFIGAILVTLAKLNGFYSQGISWRSIYIYDVAIVIFSLTGIFFISSLTRWSWFANHKLFIVKFFAFVFLNFQWIYMLVAFPGVNFEAFIFYFVIISSFFLNIKFSLLNFAMLTLSSAFILSSRSKGNFFSNSLIVVNVVTSYVCVVMTLLSILIFVYFVRKYLIKELNYVDSSLYCLNDLALKRDFFSMRRDKRNQILGIYVEGLDNLKSTMGSNPENDRVQVVTEILNGITKTGKVYYLSKNMFVLVDEPYKSMSNIIEKLQHKCSLPMYINDTEINVSMSMCLINSTINLMKSDDLIGIIESSLRKAQESATEKVVCVTQAVINEANRDKHILKTLRTAIKERKFEVFYQPIYSVKDESYCAAEALIRLLDYDLGYISPDVFIPLAEQNGLILEIGKQVFEQVCQFIATDRIWERGIKYIDVNLSAVQCMQEKLHEQLVHIMDYYDIDYKMINLEVTETAFVSSEGRLIENMNNLMEKGINFSLDDYGTGYANTAAVIKYPFKMIKLDRSMLWSAMENDKSMQALKYTIPMIKAMDMKIVVEGVETEEQMKTLKELECDFLQGFLFSKPLSKDAFMKLCSERK